MKIAMSVFFLFAIIITVLMSFSSKNNNISNSINRSNIITKINDYTNTNSSSNSSSSSSSSSRVGIAEDLSKVNTSEIILIDKIGDTILTRFKTPKDYERINVESGSYGEYLRNFKLKPDGAPVKYYNGAKKQNDVYEAVLEIDTGNRDLQQCADAVMRLWSEYNYHNGKYDKIHFNFTNGFSADYTKWREGNFIRVNGNNAQWVSTNEKMDSYKSFRNYLNMVFSYAGTLSLSQELKKIPLKEIRIGDIFLKGSTPGHCVLVVDMAKNNLTGERIFMLAQSYMPAQDIHILKNYESSEISPWYSINFGEKLNTPEWTFDKEQVFRFN